MHVHRLLPQRDGQEQWSARTRNWAPSGDQELDVNLRVSVLDSIWGQSPNQMRNRVKRARLRKARHSSWRRPRGNVSTVRGIYWVASYCSDIVQVSRINECWRTAGRDNREGSLNQTSHHIYTTQHPTENRREDGSQVWRLLTP